MKLKILALGFCFTSFQASAQQSSGNYNKSAFYGFHELPSSSRTDGRNTSEKISQYFPGMYARIDKLNGSFTDVFGKALEIPGSSLNEKISFCFNQLKHFGIDRSEWKPVRDYSAPHASFVSYEQYKEGHRVAFSRLSFRFAPDGKLERIQLKNYGHPEKGLLPELSTAAAKIAAVKDLNQVSITENTIEDSWEWFPVPSEKGYSLRPAYVFNITGKDETMPVELTGYLDAITGEVLYRDNTVHETVQQTVQGSVYKNGFLQPSSLEPLAHLKMTINGTDYYTDSAGLLDVPNLNAPLTATVKLEGKWSKVNAMFSGGAVPTFQNTITVSGGNYIFPTTTPSSDRHVNAYYHVNTVHDFMKGFFPAFNYLDFPMNTNVDVTGSCNAFYSGQNTSINFYTAGNGCNSLANVADVVYHEYGHGINHQFYRWQGVGSMRNRALNEAHADIWGMSISKNPILGEGFTTTGGFIRRYDINPKVYPQDLVGEEHADGEIIAGAWWDLGILLGSVDSMTKLFTKTYYDLSDGPNGTEGEVYHQVLISALLNDDNDNNLSNGSPNFNEIVKAFRDHGIYLLGDSKITHTEIAHPAANAAIDIFSNLDVSVPAFFQDLKLYYKERTGTAWDSVTMTQQSGNLYGAQIPARPAGTIVDYYFAVYDNDNYLNIIYPKGYSSSLPSSSSNIPYQFGVGLEAKTTIDFNNPLSGWIIGNVPGDNAKSGKWIQAKPVGSFVNPVTQEIPVQPGSDHTGDPKGFCLVTGNAPSIISAAGTNDVDSGRTSVITSTFDLSDFEEPIVEYWRWYSNNSGSSPGRDSWSAHIKDSASASWFFRVDFTKASDNSWRRRIFNVKEFLPNSKKINLKFVAEDMSPESTVEAAVDDLVIYDKAAPNSVEQVQKMRTDIYPNPADKVINLKFSAPFSGTIGLYDQTGRVLFKEEISQKQIFNLNTESVAPGTYFINMHGKGFIRSHKIVVGH